MYKNYIKRILDLLLSLLALLALWPLMLMIFILVFVEMGRPILFCQKRVGKDEKIFWIYKFRTMNDKRDANGKLLPDQERLTRLGRVLRGTSLDELPQIFNIVLGDLSIVGPRSLLPEYLPYYTEYERQRHQVRGGLTVPEVLYNNPRPTWEEQFRCEVEYAKNVSFLIDMKIIWSTIAILLKRSKSNYGEYVRPNLMQERMGYAK